MNIKGILTVLLLATGSASASAQRQPALDSLDAYIARSVEAFDQPGLAVGIVKDGRLVWSHGYGKLDLAKPEPVTPNSIFYLASMTKAFTACAIGLLVDEGKMSFDDPVRKYLPAFKTPDDYVTEHFLVRDLLCHRSGWDTFDGDLLWYGTRYTQQEILARHAQEPFSFGFRERFGYSNLMFIAAAQVIEHVSGMSWEQFITARILKPLGMERTRVNVGDLTSVTDVALPHVRKNQDPHAPQLSMPYQKLAGADGPCGVLSCVNDLAKWDAMWMNEGRLGDKPFLKEETWTAITTDQLSFEVAPEEAAMGKHYDGAAMGWFTEDRDGYKIITHSGGMPGFVLNHAVVPEKDFAVICLGNGESYSVFAITDYLIDQFLGSGDADPTGQMIPRLKKRDEREAKRVAGREAARVKNTKPSLPLASYAGTYIDKIYGEATIIEKDGALTLSFAPAPELFTGPLQHWHYDTFQWSHADPFLEKGYITFNFDADHRVTGFKVDLHSPDFHFWKLDFKRQP